ncbi:unnamed protein product [Aphanomyces euteiches]|uniref:Uncharacterized protein n=1 Tax=Aphanomyces euteiches TaxID=100861 RepID=A0A6G0WAA7_9STRA|nr:hypothetical protein Ae201684_017115 [Aphanomyces euteiches]KAH9074000.1 hypothetical protein Ae201684P_015899 [Aphanomyces euteiches]KAH9132177.1 hypothetical protein AeRB84_021347 [Aphanomyces euteiches]
MKKASKATKKLKASDQGDKSRVEKSRFKASFSKNHYLEADQIKDLDDIRSSLDNKISNLVRVANGFTRRLEEPRKYSNRAKYISDKLVDVQTHLKILSELIGEDIDALLDYKPKPKEEKPKSDGQSEASEYLANL